MLLQSIETKNDTPLGCCIDCSTMSNTDKHSSTTANDPRNESTISKYGGKISTTGEKAFWVALGIKATHYVPSRKVAVTDETVRARARCWYRGRCSNLLFFWIIMNIVCKTTSYIYVWRRLWLNDKNRLLIPDPLASKSRSSIYCTTLQACQPGQFHPNQDTIPLQVP